MPGPDHARIEDIGLELHQEVVPGSAAVNADSGYRSPRVGGHGVHKSGALIGDGFERGPREVGPVCSAIDAHNGPAGIRVPVGRAQAREPGDQVDAVVIRNRSGEDFRFGRTRDQAQAVAQPLNGRSGAEDGTFQGVGRAAAGIAGQCGEQAVFRRKRFGPRVKQGEAACPIGVLDVALGYAALPEEGGLLVSRDTGDGDTRRQWSRARRPAELVGGGVDLGENRPRNVERVQQIGVPCLRVDIETHGAGCVGEVRRVCLAASQAV